MLSESGPPRVRARPAVFSLSQIVIDQSAGLRLFLRALLPLQTDPVLLRISLIINLTHPVGLVGKSPNRPFWAVWGQFGAFSRE
jgi:hypothetical protein